MNTYQNKDTTENNTNINTTSNVLITMEIAKDHKNENEIVDLNNKSTVINIEDEQLPNSTNVYQNNRKNYWIMFFGTRPQQKTPAVEQTSWFPWNYIPGYGSSTPATPKPPALDYKPETRNSFVKLVMTIVLIMILSTAAFVGFVLMTPDVKDFFQHSGWFILLPAFVILLIVDYGMMCIPCTRKPPCNIVFLFLAVVAMSLISAKITTHYETKVVLYAIIGTAAIVLVCILLACSSFDFTRWMLYVIVIATALSAVLIIVLIIRMTTGAMLKPIVLGILVVLTVFQGIILTMQLQTILGGKAVELNESDYAYGAFMIYTSIIDIFIKLVQILGIADM